MYFTDRGNDGNEGQIGIKGVKGEPGTIGVRGVIGMIGPVGKTLFSICKFQSDSKNTWYCNYYKRPERRARNSGFVNITIIYDYL
jgi:hypothetical protein